MSNLSLSTISGTVASSNTVSIPAGQVLYAPGHVIQVVQNHIWLQSAVSIPAGYTTATNIPDLTCSITPKSVSSKIYVMVRWFGEFSVVGATWNSMWNIKRGTTLIGRDPSWPTDRATGLHVSATSYTSADGNSTPESTIYNYLDSPNSTATQTYTACIMSADATTIYTNRTVGVGATSFENGTSSITLWEIAQ